MLFSVCLVVGLKSLKVCGAGAQQTNLDRKHEGEQRQNKTHRDLQRLMSVSPQLQPQQHR